MSLASVPYSEQPRFRANGVSFEKLDDCAAFIVTPRGDRFPALSWFGSETAMAIPQLRLAAARLPIEAHNDPPYCVATFALPQPTIVRSALTSLPALVRSATSGYPPACVKDVSPMVGFIVRPWLPGVGMQSLAW